MKPVELATRAALVAAGLLVVELGLRAWHAAGGGPPGGPAAALRRTADELGGAAFEQHTLAPEAEGEVPMLHPYFGFGPSGVDERLARHGEAFTEDDGGRLDIVVAGGSVAVKFLRNYTEDLLEQVSADPRFAGREVRLLNLAHGGNKQPQHVIRLVVALGLGWRPDAVVLIDGYNELVFPAQNAHYDVEPFYPAFSQWGPLLPEGRDGPAAREARYQERRQVERAETLVERLERWGLDHSAVVSQLAWWRMRPIAAAHRAALEELVASAAGEGSPVPGARDLEPFDERLLDAAVDVWVQHARSMHALCAERGIAFVHVLQPTRDDEGAKPLTADELADEQPDEWLWAVREGYPRLRAAGERLRSSGVRFVDASRIYEGIEEPLYVDRCHLNTRGNVLLGAAIMPALLAELP